MEQRKKKRSIRGKGGRKSGLGRRRSGQKEKETNETTKEEDGAKKKDELNVQEREGWERRIIILLYPIS